MKLNCFVYSKGVFTPDDNEFGLSLDDDIEKDLDRAGYLPSQKVGSDFGLGFMLYESDDNWIVEFGTTCRFTLILCETWPDLIMLLRDLSQIALATAHVQPSQFHDSAINVRVVDDSQAEQLLAERRASMRDAAKEGDARGELEAKQGSGFQGG